MASLNEQQQKKKKKKIIEQIKCEVYVNIRWSLVKALPDHTRRSREKNKIFRYEKNKYENVVDTQYLIFSIPLIS